MRVATFNILNGRSTDDDRVDIGRFAMAIHELDADVLGLQEVDRNQPRSDNVDLTAVAAEAMGAAEHRFVPAMSGTPGTTWIAATGDEHPDSAAYGISLLSRHPIRSWEVIRLPAAPVKVPWRFHDGGRPVLVRDEPRVAVAAVVDTPQGEMTIVNTHLSFITWWNRRQLRRLIRCLGEAPRPLVLLGDLNMGARPACDVTRMHPLATGLTFPADQPTEQLDHILAAGELPGTTGAVHHLDLSDHRALSVDFD